MLRSLLVSRDDKTVHIVRRVFRDLEVEFEHCSEASIALETLPKKRYDAIVLDDQIEEAAAILERVIVLPSCNKSVRIVLAEPVTALQAVFKTGTHVILYKPLSLERVRHGLRAVRNLMARDRRRGATRIPTMLSGRISPRQARNAGKQILVADLSDSGAAIRCEDGDVPTSGNLNLEFTLPGNPETIHATAEVVWQDNDGAAGVRFLDMPSYSRKRLVQWLREQTFEKQTRAVATRAGK